MMYRKQLFLVLMVLLCPFGHLAAQSNSTEETHPYSDTIAALKATAWNLLHSHPDSTIILAKRMLLFSDTANDLVGKLDATRRLGYAYMTMNQFDSAKHWLETSFAFREEYNDTTKLITGYSDFGEYYINTSDFEAAIASYESGIKLARQINHVGKESVAISGLAFIYFKQGEIRKCIDLYYQLHELDKKLGDTISMGKHWNNVYPGRGLRQGKKTLE